MKNLKGDDILKKLLLLKLLPIAIAVAALLVNVALANPMSPNLEFYVWGGGRGLSQAGGYCFCL